MPCAQEPATPAPTPKPTPEQVEAARQKAAAEWAALVAECARRGLP